jgi:hypothetical protein
MQIHPAAPQLDLVDLPFAVLLAAGLQRQQLRVSREALQLREHLSYRHAPRVVTRTPPVHASWAVEHPAGRRGRKPTITGGAPVVE